MNTSIVTEADKRMYHVWVAMRQRCTNPGHKSYKYYGARGIKVCARWGDWRNFFDDMGTKPTPSHTIERINNDAGYSPDNCRWATWTEQQHNKRKGKCNSSGVVGVSWHKASGKWVVQMSINGKRTHMGLFESLPSAITARRAAEAKYWHGQA